jgi:hypothetical protein
MNLRAVFQASFISLMRVLGAQSAVLNLMNLVKGRNDSESNFSLPSLADKQAGIAENSRTVPSFLHLVQGQPAAALRYAASEPAQCITGKKRHRLTATEPRLASMGYANVVH